MANHIVLPGNICKSHESNHLGPVNLTTNYLDFKRNHDNKLFVPKPFTENLGKEAYIFVISSVELINKHMILQYYYDNLTLDVIQEVYDKHVTRLVNSPDVMTVKKLYTLTETINTSLKSVFQHANAVGGPMDNLASCLQVSIYVVFAE